ncbi:MAG: C40 family peptidase [Solobacterium sp.]|nr:C40 family peptidase [Solobacterium sp.]
MLKKLCITLICILCILMYPATRVHADNSTTTTTTTSTQSGWITTDGHRQWIDENGNPAIGWKTLDNQQYYFDENGYMVIGKQLIDNKFYLFNADGILNVTPGWIFQDSHYYWIEEDHTLAASTWKFINNYYYYFSDDAIMQTGWIELGQNHYYLNDSGAMLTGWQFIDGHWYYLAEGGSRMSGWLYVDKYWYYLDPKNNDAMVTGWLWLNNQWYYLRPTNTGAPSGSMIANSYLYENGHLYQFADGGPLINTQLVGGLPSSNPTSIDYNRAINTALSFVGKVPYVWGGASPSGFDCSGLVQYCYGVGERTTYVQQHLGTHRYDVWNAPAGALYFWGTDSSPYHVGISLGNGMTVQAMNESDGIKVIGISSFMPSYYIVIGQ